MMEFRPAELAHYATLFPAAGARQWKAAAVQILSGPAWTLFAAGAPCLICGLYPFHSGILEAWLMLPDGHRPRLAVLRFLIERAATVFPERILITRVDDANRAGQRLALLAGFVPVDEFLAGMTVRTWARPQLAGLAPPAASGNVTGGAGA